MSAKQKYTLRKLINTRTIDFSMIADLGLTFNQYVELSKMNKNEFNRIIDNLKEALQAA